MRRPRRRWTSNDDRLVIKLNADGKSDGEIARIIDRQRADVHRHRVKLRLKSNRKGGRLLGSKMPESFSIWLSKRTRDRWNNDPEYRAKKTEMLREIARARVAKLPRRGTAEYNIYIKFCRALGKERAKQELGL